MPELDAESDHPPFVGASLKSLSENPDTDEHHQRIGIVKHLRFDQPGKPETEKASRFRNRPVENIDLEGLKQMFRPVREHDKHKDLKCRLMPLRINSFVKAVPVYRLG